MQENFEEASFVASGKKQKKRLQYKRMSEEKKKDLIFRVMYLNENVRTVCHELGFNFSTGRNLVQRYKKTGEYVSQEKVAVSSPSTEFLRTNASRESDAKTQKCSLGLILFSDDKIKLVTSRMYTAEEERALVRLNQQFVSAGTV